MGNAQPAGGVLAGGAAESALQAGTNHSVLPVDNPPYPGPQHEFRIVAINSQLQGKFTMGLRAGEQLTKTDLQNYYGSLGNQYTEFYRMATFFQVPLAQRQSGFTKAVIPYQGIFSRPKVYVPSPERWSLQIQQTTLNFSFFGVGRFFSTNYTYHPPSADPMPVCAIINDISQKGGRLLCMECTGTVFSTGMSFSRAGAFGIDIFFEIPQHPNPTIYAYTVHSTPMQVQNTGGATSVVCDWNGTLTMYIDQGWRLIDILMPLHEATGQYNRNDRHYYREQQNVLWFFEKENLKINDPTPRYQVTMVEYYVDAKDGFRGIKTNFDLTSLLTEMGSRGWELVAVLDTPQMSTVGFGKVRRGCIIFFQRPLVKQPIATPPIQAPGITPQPTYSSLSVPPGPPPSYSPSQDRRSPAPYPPPAH